VSHEPGAGDHTRATLLFASGGLAAVVAAARAWKRHRDRTAGPGKEPVDRAPDEDPANTLRLKAREASRQTAKRNKEIHETARPRLAELTTRYESDDPDLLNAVRAELKCVETELEAAHDGNVGDARVIELEAIALAHRKARLRARSHTDARGPLDAAQRRTLEDGVRTGNAVAKPGDVWWVEIPYDNRDEDDRAKVRPAVVVKATAEPCTPSAHYTVIWATSQQKRDGWPGYLATATLRSWPLDPSWLKLNSRVERSGLQMGRYAGELGPADLTAVTSARR
jgi:PemK-like, MazF-like toxin of type II toxin-antitoxin system